MSRLVPLVRRWGFAVVWVTLPFTAGPAFADALSGRSRAVTLVAATGLWLLWAAALAAALAASTVALTVIRLIAPAAVAAAVWAALAVPDGADTPEAVALGFTTVAALVALSGAVGGEFVNGSAYGDERRLPLRPPGPLLFGPIEVVWALVVVARRPGRCCSPLGSGCWAGSSSWRDGPSPSFCARALHQLARRWLVFVPAGVVVHDRATLADAMLVPRTQLAWMGPAPADTTATDLTANALGLALELHLTEPDEISLAPPRGSGVTQIEPTEVEAVMVTPSRPGAVLAEAAPAGPARGLSRARVGPRRPPTRRRGPRRRRRARRSGPAPPGAGARSHRSSSPSPPGERTVPDGHRTAVGAGLGGQPTGEGPVPGGLVDPPHPVQALGADEELRRGDRRRPWPTPASTASA